MLTASVRYHKFSALQIQGDLEAEKKVAIVPPRIDSNSNIPVRRQQKVVRAKEVTPKISKCAACTLALLASLPSCLQEAEAAAKRVPYKQTFRKAKIDPEQRAEVMLGIASAYLTAHMVFSAVQSAVTLLDSSV